MRSLFHLFRPPFNLFLVAGMLPSKFYKTNLPTLSATNKSASREHRTTSNGLKGLITFFIFSTSNTLNGKTVSSRINAIFTCYSNIKTLYNLASKLIYLLVLQQSINFKSFPWPIWQKVVEHHCIFMTNL